MDLFKNFALGGLFQAGKRMAPPWGAFRRYTNTYKDPINTLQPYGRGEEVDNIPVVPTTNGSYGQEFLGPVSSQFYRKGILQLGCFNNGAKYLGALSYLGNGNTNLPIMQPFSIDNGNNIVDIRKHMQYLPSGNLSTCTVARKAYLNSCINTTEYDATKDIGGFTPEESWLISFDGIRSRGAGLPTPWTFADYTGIATANYVRGVYATIGLDGELILSPYLQIQLLDKSRLLYLSGYSAYPGTPRPDVAGMAGSFPSYRRPEDHLFEKLKTTNFGFGAAGSNTRYFDKRFVKPSNTTVTTVTAGEISTTNVTYSPALEVGDWVMADMRFTAGTIDADLYMFKVKTLGTTIVYEKNFKYFDRFSVSWIDADFQSVKAEWDAINPDLSLQFTGVFSEKVLTNIFLIVSYSTTASSGYRVNNIYPIAWDSADAGEMTDFSTPMFFPSPWAGVISSFMSDWYDTNTVRTTFPPLKGVTNYKELLVGFDSNAIYFNDVSLGGSTEMVGGLSNIVPYGSEYGDIISICGSEDFLFMSRERKNYIITGDIAGSSFNITECDVAVPGAYNAKCSTNAWSGQVIFTNAAGVFSVGSSGNIKDIAEEIKGLFFGPNKDKNLFDKAVFKTLEQTRSDGKDGGRFKFFLEDTRGFVILLTAKDSTDNTRTVSDSNMLVYNTKDNKWYEFEGVIAPTAEAINGKIVVMGVTRAKEDGIMRGEEQQLLVTQRMTIDQPSLEKQFVQLKMFGEFTPTSSAVLGMTVGQINDWLDFDPDDRSAWNTNVVYTPELHEVYAHKKRLNSSKPVSTSIILESLLTGSFNMEGMEVEGVMIQTGIKK